MYDRIRFLAVLIFEMVTIVILSFAIVKKQKASAVLRSALSKRNSSKLFIGIILFSIIVIPIVRMLFYIDGKALNDVFKSPVFYTCLVNSLTSTIAATLVSIVLAYGLAWAINKTHIKLKYLFTVLITLPMLIPSISHGMGLIILFGNNGILTRLFGLTKSIYGFWGVVFGSVLYSFPVAFIMISDILKYEDQTPYEAADVLGIPKPRQFASITLPYIRKPMISVLFAVFTMIVTDYGVTLSVGGKFRTLPVLLFEDAAGQLKYANGSVIGMVLLIPALAAFLFDLFNKDKGNSTYVSKSYDKKSVVGDIFGYIITILTSVIVGLVVFSFVVQAFAKAYPSNMSFSLEHFETTFIKNGKDFLINSVIIAILTSIVGVVIAFATAYMTTRLKSSFSRFLHLMAIISLAVPGLVLGLSYVIVFKKTFIYGTLAILVMVNIVHFFASPYLMIYNALGKMNENLEDVGHILGIKRSRIIFNVIIPQSKYTLIEMFSYFFVNSMMTISAVSFLANYSNKPISLLINQFESHNMMECAAVVALLILVINMAMKGIVYLIKTIGNRYVVKKAV